MSRPEADFRSSTMLRLLRLCQTHRGCSVECRRSRLLRCADAGLSIWMTSAPRSASTVVPNLTGENADTSRIRMPSSSFSTSSLHVFVYRVCLSQPERPAHAPELELRPGELCIATP